jgi:hypothetical protein
MCIIIKGERKYMKIPKKQMLTTLLMISIVTLAAVMATVKPAVGAVTLNIKDWAYVEPLPGKIGVGQVVTLIYGIDHVNPLATAYGPFFTGFTLTITDPEGTVETKSNLPVDSTSFGHLTYTPSKVGTYYLQLNFAGQWVNITAGTMTFVYGLVTVDTNNYYEPATSSKTLLVVQEGPVSGVERSPLPTDYWTTPVYSENKGWSSKMDNWLMMAYDQTPRFFNGMGAFSPITTGPNSPHVLWTRQLQEGGLAGAKFGDKSLYHSEVYQQYYIPLILNGKIYYVDHGPSNTGGQGGTGSLRVDNFGTRCIDLYNGEEVFYLTNVTIDMAQTLDVETPNKHGVVPYLWSIPGLSDYNAVGGAPPTEGLIWEMYDAFTGNKILTINNAISGAPTFGPSGEILVYTMGVDGTWMSLWNSSKCLFGLDFGLFASPSRDTVFDWSAGMEWNVTLNAPNAIGAPAMMAISLEEDRILICYGGRLAYPLQGTYPAVLTDCAYPTKVAPGTTTLSPAWVQNRTNLYDFVELHYNINEGMYSVFDDAELKVHTYDIKDGAELSVSPALSDRLYTIFAHTWMAYGNTYVWSYDGYVRCVDGQTGNVTWSSYLGDLAFGQAYANPPVYQGPTIADGKVYIGTSDHSPDSDMWVGSKLFCFDALTGEQLWNVTGYYGYTAISNGYLTTYNGYNVEIFTYGKGPSATTVTASPKVSVFGNEVLIEGTVTDQSPGQKGTPAISDEDMGAWMGYLHMQKAIPQNARGVTVSLKVIDANNNFRDIGTTTSDTSGSFGYTWKPDIPGQYTVIATFAGSDSYGSSSAETFFTVSEAPEATASPTQPPASAADLYFVPVSIGMIIAIVVVIILVLLILLRKR